MMSSIMVTIIALFALILCRASNSHSNDGGINLQEWVGGCAKCVFYYGDSVYCLPDQYGNFCTEEEVDTYGCGLCANANKRLYECDTKIVETFNEICEGGHVAIDVQCANNDCCIDMDMRFADPEVGIDPIHMLLVCFENVASILWWCPSFGDESTESSESIDLLDWVNAVIDEYGNGFECPEIAEGNSLGLASILTGSRSTPIGRINKGKSHGSKARRYGAKADIEEENTQTVQGLQGGEDIEIGLSNSVIYNLWAVAIVFVLFCGGCLFCVYRKK